MWGTNDAHNVSMTKYVRLHCGVIGAVRHSGRMLGTTQLNLGM